MQKLLGLDLEDYSHIIAEAIAETFEFEDFQGTFETLAERCAEGDIAGLVIEYGALVSGSERRLRSIREHLPHLPIVVLTYYEKVEQIAEKHRCAYSLLGSRLFKNWENNIPNQVDKARQLVE